MTKHQLEERVKAIDEKLCEIYLKIINTNPKIEIHNHYVFKGKPPRHGWTQFLRHEFGDNLKRGIMTKVEE